MTTVSSAKSIVVSALSAAAFLVTVAFGAEIDSDGADQATASVSDGKRESSAEVGETETAKQPDGAIATDESVKSDAHPFVSYGCYQCHGYLGQGAGSGSRLSADLPYEAFQQIVRFPYGVMPAYPRELLGDADLREIYSYVQALPHPPELKDLPLLYDTSK